MVGPRSHRRFALVIATSFALTASILANDATGDDGLPYDQKGDANAEPADDDSGSGESGSWSDYAYWGDDSGSDDAGFVVLQTDCSGTVTVPYMLDPSCRTLEANGVMRSASCHPGNPTFKLNAFGCLGDGNDVSINLGECSTEEGGIMYHCVTVTEASNRGVTAYWDGETEPGSGSTSSGSSESYDYYSSSGSSGSGFWWFAIFGHAIGCIEEVCADDLDVCAANDDCINAVEAAWASGSSGSGSIPSLGMVDFMAVEECFGFCDEMYEMSDRFDDHYSAKDHMFHSGDHDYAYWGDDSGSTSGSGSGSVSDGGLEEGSDASCGCQQGTFCNHDFGSGSRGCEFCSDHKDELSCLGAGLPPR